MLHLLQQNAALVEQAVLLQQQIHVQLFDPADVGDVVDGQQDAGVEDVVIDDGLDADDQATGCNARPHQFRLVVPQRRAAQLGVLQQQSKLWNGPFATANFTQGAAEHGGALQAEGDSEGGRYRHHAQIAVEQQQRQMRCVQQGVCQAWRGLCRDDDVGHYSDPR